MARPTENVGDTLIAMTALSLLVVSALWLLS